MTTVSRPAEIVTATVWCVDNGIAYLRLDAGGLNPPRSGFASFEVLGGEARKGDVYRMFIRKISEGGADIEP